MFVTLAIICICFFIFSFSLLFRKQLGKFFHSIFRFFKKLFFRKNKKKQEILKVNKPQIVPKMISSSSPKRIDAPDEKTIEELKENSISHSSTKINIDTDNDIIQEQKEDRRYGFSLDEVEKRKKLAIERGELDEELKKITKSFNLDEKDLEEKIKMFDKKKNLPEFITNRSRVQEKTILSKRKPIDLMSFEEKKNPAETIIDNEKIDLSNLPMNIKKLLISGILDRKDF